jgi:DNA-binding transcriptional LysR family regulator
MTGSDPWKRLAAFASLPDHRNLDHAARALGCHRKTLSRYVARLERELGQPLLHRAIRGDAIALTMHGQAVVGAITATLKTVRGGAFSHC